MPFFALDYIKVAHEMLRLDFDYISHIANISSK